MESTICMGTASLASLPTNFCSRAGLAQSWRLQLLILRLAGRCILRSVSLIVCSFAITQAPKIQTQSARTNQRERAAQNPRNLRIDHLRLQHCLDASSATAPQP